ncbi:MAG: MFS transporter [Acidobacteriota bacterium]
MPTRDESRRPGRPGTVRPPARRGLADFRRVLVECPDYRRLFLARYASLLGDWFNLLAVLALLREMGHDDARTVGLLVILKLLPSAVAGPAAGVVADRVSRKAVMIVADLVRFGFVLAMFAAPWLGADAGVVLVLVATALQITAQAFSEPARLASVPNVVPPELLGAANALGAMTWSLMFTLGAGLGGVVTSLLGWRVALAIDAASYLASVVFVVRLVLPPPPRRRPARGWRELTGLADVAEALSYLRRAPRTAALLLAKPGWGLAGAITLLLTLYGERVYPLLGRPDVGIAVLYMARGLGTALGPVITRRLVPEEPGPLSRAIGASFLLAAAAYAAFAVVEEPALAVALVVLAHVGGSTIWVFSTVLLQRRVPDRLRGRVFAAELGLATLAISAVTFVYGEAIDGWGIGLRPMTLVLAGTLLVAALLWTAAQALTRRWAPEAAEPAT